MLDHYLKIRPYMNHGLLPVLQLIPSLAEDARLREIFNNLKNFESCIKGLQKADSSLFAVRLLEKHPHLSGREKEMQSSLQPIQYVSQVLGTPTNLYKNPFPSDIDLCGILIIQWRDAFS
jgi:hypothetical protein